MMCIGYLFFQVSAYEDMCRVFVFQFSVYEVFYRGGKSTQIDSGISKVIRDTNKISMLKNIFCGNRVEREIPLMFGQITDILSSRHVTMVLTRRINLRTVSFM